MSLDFVIPFTGVRLSFPHIADPQRQPGENGGPERIKYNAEFIMTPDNPGWAKYHQIVAHIAQEKWKNAAPAVMQMVQAERKKRRYGWGQEKINQKKMNPDGTFAIYDGYQGMVFIGASRDNMPQMIDADGNGIDPANTMACQALARKMYGGCRVNVALRPWTWENKQGRGIGTDLISIQFHSDDTPFGEGVVDASGLFGATQAQPGVTAPGWGGPPGMPGMPSAPQWSVPTANPAPMGMPAPPFPMQDPTGPSFFK